MHENFARRESEYNRGTGCGKTARPGLCGGPLVTETPTVRGDIAIPISIHTKMPVVTTITRNPCAGDVELLKGK
jgi:hypothetical protein